MSQWHGSFTQALSWPHLGQMNVRLRRLTGETEASQTFYNSSLTDVLWTVEAGEEEWMSSA